MAIRESIGAVPCLCCGELVPVKKSPGGAVSVSCPWCDLSAYAKEGTQAYKSIMAKLPKPAAAAPEAAKPAAPAAPIPAPAPAPRKSVNPLFGGM